MSPPRPDPAAERRAGLAAYLGYPAWGGIPDELRGRFEGLDDAAQIDLMNASVDPGPPDTDALAHLRYRMAELAAGLAG